MSTIIPKDLMTEEDIKLNFITPALVGRGWQNKITMETKVQFTDGKVNIKGNIVSREPAKRQTISSISMRIILLPSLKRKTITTRFLSAFNRR